MSTVMKATSLEPLDYFQEHSIYVAEYSKKKKKVYCARSINAFGISSRLTPSMVYRECGVLPRHKISLPFGTFAGAVGPHRHSNFSMDS